jgi:SAM-dependent methyltransferase
VLAISDGQVFARKVSSTTTRPKQAVIDGVGAQFGVVIVVDMMIGLITLPYGETLFPPRQFGYEGRDDARPWPAVTTSAPRRPSSRGDMTEDVEFPVADRIMRLLCQLGIEKAHVAGCLSADWAGLATSHPRAIASLALVCPMLGVGARTALDGSLPVLVVSGDQGAPAKRVSAFAGRIPQARLLALDDYASPIWADVIADRGVEIGGAMLALLDEVDRHDGPQAIHLPAGRGEVAGLSYRVQGTGTPLVLLPLALAPSQWDPLVSTLAEHHCTIVLGGAELGMVAHLEARGRSGYARIVGCLIDEARLQPGERVLDVGCGTGVLDRWLARRTERRNPIVATDISRYLLAEAAALVEKEGLRDTIAFQEGDAEALPFADESFDLAMCCTVLEEGDADRMLAEMVRVTRPGGRVAFATRAIDMRWWVNLELDPDLKAKVDALGTETGGGVAANGCADASLYRRFGRTGLTQPVLLPQLAVYGRGQRLRAVEERLLAALGPGEVEAVRHAIAQAETRGTFFVAEPFHTAVGTKP